MRPILAAACLLLSSCTWVFMDKPKENYALGENPDCTESAAGGVIADGIFMGLNVASVIVAAGQPVETETRGASIAFGIGWSLIHLASAITAVSWADTCRKAKADHALRDERDEITAAEDATRRRLKARLARDEAKKAVKREADQPPAPRGFFCSSSPSNVAAGFCVRVKAECQRTRDAAIVGVADLAECALTERAFCFGDRCAPSAEGCDATRERVMGADGVAPACADRE